RAAGYFLPGEAGDVSAGDPAAADSRKVKNRFSRFSFEGLEVDRGPYAKSLWEELKEQETRAKQNREIRAARHTAKVLSLGARSAAAEAEDSLRRQLAEAGGWENKAEMERALRREEKDVKAKEKVKLQVVVEKRGAEAVAKVRYAGEEERLTELRGPKTRESSTAGQTIESRRRRPESRDCHRTYEPGAYRVRRGRGISGREECAGLQAKADAVAAREASMGGHEEKVQWLINLQEREGVGGGIQAILRPEENETEERKPDRTSAGPREETGTQKTGRKRRNRGRLGKFEKDGLAEGSTAGDSLEDNSAGDTSEEGRQIDGQLLSAEGGDATLHSALPASSMKAGPKECDQLAKSVKPVACLERKRRLKEEAEHLDASQPDQLIEETFKIKNETWSRLSPQQLQVQTQLVRARSVGQVLFAVDLSTEQVPDSSTVFSSAPFPPSFPGSSSSSAAASRHGLSRSREDAPLIDDISEPSLTAPSCVSPSLPLSFSSCLSPSPAPGSSPSSPSSAVLPANLSPINIATAIHRLGRLSTPYQASVLRKDPRFILLVSAAETALPNLDCVGLCSIFWGLVRLEMAPQWLPTLIQRLTATVPDMTHTQLSCALYCLSKMTFPVRQSMALQAALVEALKVSQCLPLTPAEAAEADQSDVVENRTDKGVRTNIPGTVACICGSLARLKVNDAGLFGLLAAQVRGSMETLTGGELATVAWAFGTMGFVDRALFRDIRRRFESRIEHCAVHEIVSIAWSFARLGQADEEFLRYTVAPAVRTFITDLTTRQLSLLAWAYAEVGVADRDFFADLSFAMLPKAKSFTAHDVMLVVPAFAQLGFANRELFRALQKRTVELLFSFSPLQLSRALYGFGLAATVAPDPRFFHACCGMVEKRLHALYPQNVTHILVGLSEAEYLSHPVVDSLLSLTGRLVPRLFAEDCVQILYVMGKLPPHRRQAGLVPLLQQQLRNKVRVFWSLDSASICDLFEALQTLGLPDEQLLHMTMRRLASVVEASSMREFLRTLGCLANLSAINRLLVRTHIHRRLKVQKAISEKLAGLAGSVGRETSDRHGRRRGAADIQSRIVVLHACGKLGYQDENVARLYDQVQQALEAEGEILSLSALCHLIWAMAETNVKINWTRSLLRYMLHRRYSSASSSTPPLLEIMEDREAYANHHGLGPYTGGEVFPCVWSRLAGIQGRSAADAKEMLCLSERGGEREAEDADGHSSNLRLEEHTHTMSTQHQRLMPGCSAEKDTQEDEVFERDERERRKTELGEALLKVAFAAVVLGEEEFIVPLLEETAALLNGALPADLLNAQQVCLHVQDLMVPAPPYISPALREWMETVLAAPRFDVFHENTQKFRTNDARLRVKDFNYDNWITEPLVQMRIPHKKTFVMRNIYRVSAAFPLERHLIDVLTFQDLLCPSNRPSGTAELRQRQLSLLGWTVHSVHLRSLYNALTSGNLRFVVASIASAVSEEALRYVTFRENEAESRELTSPKQQEFVTPPLDLADDESNREAARRLSDPWGSVRPVEHDSQVPPRTGSRRREGELVEPDVTEKAADRPAIVGDEKALEHAYQSLGSME
ncbi:kynurenine 3-monooxygenase and-related flavoprotein monooxygenase family protein, partial [Cystoisospora suis]